MINYPVEDCDVTIPPNTHETCVGTHIVEIGDLAMVIRDISIRKDDSPEDEVDAYCQVSYCTKRGTEILMTHFELYVRARELALAEAWYERDTATEG